MVYGISIQYKVLVGDLKQSWIQDFPFGGGEVIITIFFTTIYKKKFA